MPLLGQADPSALRPNIDLPQPLSPMQIAGQAATFQAIRQKMQDDQQDRQEDAQIQSVLAASQGDINKALPQIWAINQDKAAKIQKTIDESQEAKMKLDDFKLQHDLHATEYIGRQLQGVTDQQSYDYARSAIAGAGLPTDQMKPEYDPAYVDSLRQKSLSMKDQIDIAREERMAKFQEAQTARQQAAEERAQAREDRMAATQQAQLGMEKQRLGLEATRVGLERQKLAQGGPIVAPTATLEDLAKGSGYSVNGLKKAAQTYHESGLLPALGMGGGKAKQAIQNAEALLYPNSDLAMTGASFKANQGALNALTKQLGAVQAYERTGLANLKMFTDLAAKVPDTGVPWLNTPIRALSANLVGSSNMAAVNAARQVALTEISKVVNNPNLTGALSDSARSEVLGLIPEGATFKQIKRVAEVLERDMANRPSSMQKEIARIKQEMANPGGSSDTSSGGGAVQQWKRDASGKLVPQ